MARNGPKMAIYKVIFISKQSILIITLLTFQMSLNESISVILQTICTYICSQECPLTKYLRINYYLCQLKFSLEIYWISIKFWALLTFTFADQMFLAVLFLSFTFLFFKHTRLHCLATRFELNCPEAQGYFLTWLLKHSVTMAVWGDSRPKTIKTNVNFRYLRVKNKKK